MGRGRQKAKHTKVARDLKYFSPDTNYGALQKELAGNPGDPKLAEDLAAWPEYVGTDAASGSHAASGSDYDEYSDEYDDESDEDLPQHKSA
jgi:hypothetical protein